MDTASLRGHLKKVIGSCHQEQGNKWWLAKALPCSVLASSKVVQRSKHWRSRRPLLGGSVTGPAGLPLATGAIWWQTHEIWSNATRIQNHRAAAWNVKLFDTLPFQDNFTKFSYTLPNKKTRKNLLEISIHHLSRTPIHNFYGDCWQQIVFLF